MPDGKIIINNQYSLYTGDSDNKIVELLNKPNIEKLTNGTITYVKANIVKSFDITQTIKWVHTTEEYTLIDEKITYFEDNNLYPLWYCCANNTISGTLNIIKDNYSFTVGIRWTSPAQYIYAGAYTVGEVYNINYTPDDTKTSMLPLTGIIDYDTTNLRYFVSTYYNNGNGSQATFKLKITYNTTICALCINTAIFA